MFWNNLSVPSSAVKQNKVHTQGREEEKNDVTNMLDWKYEANASERVIYISSNIKHLIQNSMPQIRELPLMYGPLQLLPTTPQSLRSHTQI
jgi:hypothetical protein